MSWQVAIIGDLGGVMLIALGAVFYGAVAIRDYAQDVRYYRARRIVRNRQVGR